MARKKASQMTDEEIELFDFSDPTEDEVAEAERIAEEEAIPPIEESRPQNFQLEFRRAHGRWFLASVKNLDSGAVLAVSELPEDLEEALNPYFIGWPEEKPTRLYPARTGKFADVKSVLEAMSILWHDANLPGVEFGNLTI